jgi:D-sedoheptulose 7-phosphate isomerase
MCSEKDSVVGISTSGSSKNVVEGFKKAREIGAFTLGLTGKSGGEVKNVVERCLRLDSDVTPIIQEVHIVFT